MSEYVLTALIEAHPGYEDELKTKLQALVPPTHKEEGCLEYTLHVESEARSKFMVYEVWASEENWQSHVQSSHFLEFQEQAQAMIRQLELRRYQRSSRNP